MNYQQFCDAVFPRLSDRCLNYIPRYLKQFHRLAQREGVDYAIEEMERMATTAA